MIYWSSNGNCGWYGLMCYGLVVVGSDIHHRRDNVTNEFQMLALVRYTKHPRQIF